MRTFGVSGPPASCTRASNCRTVPSSPALRSRGADRSPQDTVAAAAATAAARYAPPHLKNTHGSPGAASTHFTRSSWQLRQRASHSSAGRTRRTPARAPAAAVVRAHASRTLTGTLRSSSSWPGHATAPAQQTTARPPSPVARRAAARLPVHRARHDRRPGAGQEADAEHVGCVPAPHAHEAPRTAHGPHAHAAVVRDGREQVPRVVERRPVHAARVPQQPRRQPQPRRAEGRQRAGVARRGRPAGPQRTLTQLQHSGCATVRGHRRVDRCRGP